MTDTEPPRTVEKQGGERPGVAHDAQFTDTFDSAAMPATWRPPNAAEVEQLREEFDGEGVVIDQLYVAVIDGYQTDQPGFAGPLAVVVGGEPNAVEGVRLHPEA